MDDQTKLELSQGVAAVVPVQRLLTQQPDPAAIEEDTVLDLVDEGSEE